MALQTQHFDHIRKRKRYDYFNLGCLITPNAAAAAEGDLLSSPVDATVYLAEINTYGIVGIYFQASGDFIFPKFPCPYDLDPHHPVGFRINFTQSAAVSVGVTWIIKAGVDTSGAAHIAAAAFAALDTPLVEKNAGGTAWENLWTSRGIKNAIGLTRDQIEDGADIRLSVESDVIDGTIANCTLKCIEMDYVSIFTKGQGHGSDLPLKTDGTG